MNKSVRYIALSLLIIYQINVSHQLLFEAGHFLVHLVETLSEANHHHDSIHHHTHENGHYHHHEPHTHSHQRETKEDHHHKFLISFEESFTEGTLHNEAETNKEIIRIPFDKHYSACNTKFNFLLHYKIQMAIFYLHGKEEPRMDVPIPPPKNSFHL